MNRTFKPGYWNSAPGPWLSLLVPAVVLALVLVWAYAGRGEVLRIPEDYPATAAEYLLKGEVPGKVLRGTLTMNHDKATLWAEVQVAPGLVVEVEKEVKSKGINPRKKIIGGY